MNLCQVALAEHRTDTNLSLSVFVFEAGLGTAAGLGLVTCPGLG